MSLPLLPFCRSDTAFRKALAIGRPSDRARIDRPNGRFPSFWPLRYLSLDGVFLSLGLRYDTVLAWKIRPRGRFSRLPQTRSQTLSIFCPRDFNDLRPQIPCSPPPGPYSGTGPRNEISEE